MRKGMNGENIVFKSVYMARTLLYIIAIYVGGRGGDTWPKHCVTIGIHDQLIVTYIRLMCEKIPKLNGLWKSFFKMS